VRALKAAQAVREANPFSIEKADTFIQSIAELYTHLDNIVENLKWQ